MLPSPSPNTARDTLGHVVSIGGSHAGVRLTVPAASDAAEGQRVTVGKFLALQTPASSVVGVITEVDGSSGKGDGEAGGALTARVDLLGEIRRTDNGFTQFQRGITGYPVVGDRVELLDSEGLRAVYDTAGADTINIGQLQQDSSIGAYVKVDEMLRKHFALFGTTGVGKSSGVAVILRQVLAAKRNLRIFLIDPHNEYARSFRDQAQVLNPRNLKLPFWLFNFEETIDVLFRGRPGLEEEVEILAQTIPQAKSLFADAYGGAGQTLRKADHNGPAFTVDTPVPYRLSDLVNLIDERMGKLENRSSTTKYSRLISRIEAVRKDLRYAFMFDNANVGGDTMVEVLEPAVPAAAQRQADDGDAARRLPGRGGRFGRLGARAHGVRVRPVERRRGPAPVRVRGGASLCPRRQEHRLRAHPQGRLAHRQGRPEIRRVSGPGDAAAGRARCHDHFPVQHALCHAHGERSRPGRDPGRRLGCGRQPAGVRAVARHARGLRLRRGRATADAAALRPARRRVHPEEQIGGSGERIDAMDGIDTAFIEKVVERWRGATMGNKRKAGEGALDEANPPGSPALEAERPLPREAALNLRREPSSAPAALARSARK